MSVSIPAAMLAYGGYTFFKMFKEVTIAKEIDSIVAIGLFFSWAFNVLVYGSLLAMFIIVPALIIMIMLCANLGYSMNNPTFAYPMFITSAISISGLHYTKTLKIFFEE